MPFFGDKSKERLSQVHPDLQRLLNEVIKTYDCVILCGYRGKEEQEAALRDGKSRVHFPDSKHNHLPSLAVDVAPYPVDWSDTKDSMKRWYHFVGYVKATAERMGIPIRCGADWDGDFDFKDQNFNDLPHFELVL